MKNEEYRSSFEFQFARSTLRVVRESRCSADTDTDDRSRYQVDLESTVDSCDSRNYVFFKSTSEETSRWSVYSPCCMCYECVRYSHLIGSAKFYTYPSVDAEVVRRYGLFVPREDRRSTVFVNECVVREGVVHAQPYRVVWDKQPKRTVDAVEPLEEDEEGEQETKKEERADLVTQAFAACNPSTTTAGPIKYGDYEFCNECGNFSVSRRLEQLRRADEAMDEVKVCQHLGCPLYRQ